MYIREQACECVFGGVGAFGGVGQGVSVERCGGNSLRERPR